MPLDASAPVHHPLQVRLQKDAPAGGAAGGAVGARGGRDPRFGPGPRTGTLRAVNMERTAGRKLVFLGPSLGLAEARGLCPDAEFLPPIRFGDLYALGCEPPGQVLIVDGVFHDSTPVWQREILQLLRTGWRVLGASSMGALRALELEPYGMIGLGRVFEWYRSGRIEGDDEVALLHGTADMDYLPLTLPLVDVRHALGGLEAQGALAPAQVSGILRAFKPMGHEMRTLRALSALVRAEGADVAAVRDRLSDRAHGLKAQDARLALRVLAGRLPLPAAGVRWPDPVPPPVEPEALFQRRIRPLAGPSLEVSEVLRAMAQQPEPWLRSQRESSRRWFLCDWVRVSGQGPGAGERRAFALRHATGLARALGVPLARWCAASALRDDELAEWMAGLAVESWLAGQSAQGLGIAHPLQGDEPSLIPLVLVDWMRRHGVEAPPEHRAGTGHMASWLVRMGPAFFGAPDYRPDVALIRTVAATGRLARWGRIAPAPAPLDQAP